jgi:hypothetical protein
MGVRRVRRRRRWRYLRDGWRPEPIAAYRGTVEDPEPDRAGICCSGGGIRSAAFNLGALQALQRASRLRGEKGARYLAAVSGGSYIAAAFAMVAKASPGGAGDNSDSGLIDDEHLPFAPRSPEEQYLRNRTSYLAPDGMSKLYLGYRVVQGLLFNLIFISLPFFGVTMLLGVLVYRHTFRVLVGACHQASSASGCPRSVHLPLWCWVSPAALAALSLLLGMVVLLGRVHPERNRRALQVWSTRLLVGAAGVALVTVALPELVALLHVHGHNKVSSTGTNQSKLIIGGAAGFGGLLTGVGAQLRELFKKLEEADSWWKKLSAGVRQVLAYAAAAIIGPLLLYGVMVFSLSLTLANVGAGSLVSKPALWWLLGGLGALALFGACYFCIDLTSLSLHPFYRRRLCTAFALRRVRPEIAAHEQQRERGIAVERDYDELVRLSQTGLEPDGWPTLLMCAAANVSDPGATPPGRKVTSFTFSAHTIGGPLIGATTTETFERALGRRTRERDLTLPAAMAISGAAIAPSMGKMTRRPLTFLMALANIRLGVWIPNPRWVEGLNREPQDRPWPKPRPSYLVRELLGRNRVDGRYLFVTDGGHYENLGLVELLRRGCTKIYCFDASGGSKFGELGDAIALARSEMGIEIRIDPSPLTPKSTPTGAQEATIAQTCAVKGTFTYADAHKTEGVLIYARNVMTRSAPWDVKAYQQQDPAFPHDPTIDQLYTDQRFESYRALGERAGLHATTLMAQVEAGQHAARVCESSGI